MSNKPTIIGTTIAATFISVGGSVVRSVVVVVVVVEVVVVSCLGLHTSSLYVKLQFEISVS